MFFEKLKLVHMWVRYFLYNGIFFMHLNNYFKLKKMQSDRKCMRHIIKPYIYIYIYSYHEIKLLISWYTILVISSTQERWQNFYFKVN